MRPTADDVLSRLGVFDVSVNQQRAVVAATIADDDLTDAEIQALTDPRALREPIDGGLVASTISLPGDASAIREAVADYDVKLIVLDQSAGAWTSSTHHDPVSRCAARWHPWRRSPRSTSPPLSAIMHPNESAGTNALAGIADSGAFTQLARSVLFQGADPTDPEADRGRHKVLGAAEANITPSSEHALALYIDSVSLDPDGERTEQPRIVVAGASEGTAGDVLAASHDSVMAEARQFLREELASGPPRPKEADIAERTTPSLRGCLGFGAVVLMPHAAVASQHSQGRSREFWGTDFPLYFPRAWSRERHQLLYGLGVAAIQADFAGRILARGALDEEPVFDDPTAFLRQDLRPVVMDGPAASAVDAGVDISNR